MSYTCVYNEDNLYYLLHRTMKVDKLWFFYITVCTVHAADIQYMKGAIETHFSDTRHHLPQYSSYKSQAKEYIHDEFTRFGLEVIYHTFTETLDGEKYTFQTVIGILRGQRFGSADDILVGLGAHYDSVSTTKGVDDNGSGVAAMLEVARTLTDASKNGIIRQNTIIFASFDLEEHRLTGSNVFVQSWLPQWINAYYDTTPRSHGVIILDTIMEYNRTIRSQLLPPEATDAFQQLFPSTISSILSDGSQGDFLLLIYRTPTNDSALADIFNTSWASANRKEFEIEPFGLPFDRFSSLSEAQQLLLFPFLRSDHANFWVADIPAIFLTDSANFRGDMIHCYHNPCDDLDTMLTDDNLEFLNKTTDALIDTMHHLSEPSRDTSRSPASAVEVHPAWTLIAAFIIKYIYNEIFV